MRLPPLVRLAVGAAVVAAAVAGCSRSAQSHLDRGNAHLEKAQRGAATRLALEKALKLKADFEGADEEQRLLRTLG